MSETQHIIYVADPMCSWCWGFAKEIKKVQAFARHKNIDFNITVGGLRVGGGQAWDDEFKNMLRHHWQQVNLRSGQEFGYKLFDLPEFNYDTEPACRAVVVAKNLCTENDLEPSVTLDFFVAIQQKFYVQSQDPKKVEFYQGICEQTGLDFAAFSQMFESDELKAQTNGEFDITRKWGVSGYPTLVYSDGKQLYMISSGYQKYESIVETLNQLADI